MTDTTRGPARFREGDLLEMKKKHPCGGNLFRVLRSGSDVRIRCEGCARDLTLPREQLEKAIRRVRPGDGR